MRKKLVFWLKGLVLFGFCVVSIFLLGAGFNNTSYAYAEEGAIDSGPFSEADANAHPVNGWDSKKEHYYENGQQVCSKEIYDAKDKNWYWIDTNGSVARNKDVYLQSNGGKWVYYDLTTGKMLYGERYVNYDQSHAGWYHFDENIGAMSYGFYFNSPQHKWVYYDHASGQMLYGEQLINGHWYDFDESTGAMQYGFVHLSKSQKWVFYDRRMGWMLYGERPIDGAWYLLDAHTGAVQYGWQRLGGKTVCYSWPSGKMLYGKQNVNNATYYFDNRTGALDTRRSSVIPSDYVGAAAGAFGNKIKSGRYRSVRLLGDSIAAGVGAANTYPCTSRELFQLEGVTYYEPSHQTDMAANSLRRYLESRGVSMTNASAPGKGSYSGYNSIGDATLGHEDAVIVLLGANDRLRLSNSGDFKREAESYLNRVAARYGADNVYVLANIDTLSDPRSLTMGQENTVLQDICRQHGWHFASMYSAFRTVGRSTGIPQQALYKDGIHPNRMGQVVMWRALQQLLGL